MKGKSGVGVECDDGKGALCLCLASVRQAADSSPPTIQTQSCHSGNGRKPRPTPGNWLLE